jgi:hypothetical protein
MRRLWIVLLAAIALFRSYPLSCQSNAADSGVAPRRAVSIQADGGLPLGSDADVFGFGFGGSLRGSLALGGSGRLAIEPSFAFMSSPLGEDVGKSISSLSLGAGLEARLLNLGPVGASAFAAVGGFAAHLSDSGWGFNPAFEAGLRIGLSSRLSPTLSVSYRNRLGLESEFGMGLGLSYALGASSASVRPSAAPAKASPLEMVSLELDSVFPVFYKHYDDHPVGRLVLRNAGKKSVSGVEVRLFAKQFMDNPKAAKGPSSIEPGAEASYELYGLFTDAILGVSEGTKVSANVDVAFSGAAGSSSLPLTATMTVYDRNASTWDDDRRVAAFVTAKDPLVLKFAKNGVPAQGEAARFRLPDALGAAAVAFESLKLYGMRYVVDPASSYSALSSKEGAVDFIQFPRQTLDFKAGDCDDLSILYCALLEAVGASTAFITVPGHIYVAVDLGMAPDKAKTKFSRPDDLISYEGSAWLPVEVTALGGDFLAAWELGAREWREASSTAQGAALYPLREAWKTYAPVGLSSEKAEAAPPSADTLRTSCAALFKRLADRESQASANRVLAEIKKSGETAGLLNKLGVVYASYGLDDKAESQFKAALSKQEYGPAAFNLGNLAYLTGDRAKAVDYYRRAYKKNPQNLQNLLALARVSYELEDRDSVANYYKKLKAADPAVASRYAYLVGGEGQADSVKASDAGAKEIVWSE